MSDSWRNILAWKVLPGSMFEVGDKVVPISKSIVGPLRESNAWRRAQRRGQKFLYVIRTGSTESSHGNFQFDEDTYTCSENEDDTCGDWFYKRDLEPYYETTSSLKLGWKVQTEYSYEEMLPMLQRGQIWRAYHSLFPNIYLYVDDPTIETTSPNLERPGVIIRGGSWVHSPDLEISTNIDNNRAGIWKCEEPYELLDREWISEKVSSQKLGWQTKVSPGEVVRDLKTMGFDAQAYTRRSSYIIYVQWSRNEGIPIESDAVTEIKNVALGYYPDAEIKVEKFNQVDVEGDPRLRNKIRMVYIVIPLQRQTYDFTAKDVAAYLTRRGYEPTNYGSTTGNINVRYYGSLTPRMAQTVLQLIQNKFSPDTTMSDNGRRVQYFRIPKKIIKDSSLKLAAKDVGCVMVGAPKKIADKIKEFAKSIPETDLYYDKDPDEFSQGREDWPHVTALFGLKTQDPDDVTELLADFGEVEFELGEVSLFENDDKPYDVVKVDVESPDLKRMNTLLCDNLEYETDFPDFHPHLTIAYAQKGKGKEYIGKGEFEGMKASTDEYYFSNADGKQRYSLVTKETNSSLQLTDKQESDLNSVLDIQGTDGNWDFEPYMTGMFNGMELMDSIVDEREPKFRDCTEKKSWKVDPRKLIRLLSNEGGKAHYWNGGNAFTVAPGTIGVVLSETQYEYQVDWEGYPKLKGGWCTTKDDDIEVVQEGEPPIHDIEEVQSSLIFNNQ